MFRSDGLPWWAEDGGSTAKASIAVIPSIDMKSAQSAKSVHSSPSADATGFVLAATECWLQALGEVKAQQAGKGTSTSTTGVVSGRADTSIGMENACRALLALTPPISSQEDAVMFVNALFDLFSRIAPLHASACPSAPIADAAATSVLLTITNILGSSGGERRTQEKKREKEEDDDQPNTSKEETNNKNNSSNNILTEQQKTEEAEAIAVEPKPIVSSSSFSSCPPEQQQHHKQMGGKEDSLFTAVRLLAAASVPGAVHQQYAMCTRAASTAIGSLSDEMIGLANVCGGDDENMALSEEALNAFVRPRIENRLARSSHEQNTNIKKAEAEEDDDTNINKDAVVVDASVLRHFADYFGEKAETARVMIDAWSEFIVPQASSSLLVDQKEHLMSLDRLTLSVHALTAAYIVLSRSIASNTSESNTTNNNSASSVLPHAFAEMASAALTRIARPISDRVWLGRIRKALSAKLAEVGSSTLSSSSKVSVVSPLALASSLSALLVQLSKLELIFGGVGLHPSDSLYSHPPQQYLRQGNKKDLHDHKDSHPQPYTTRHPLRRFHTKAFLLQPTSPAKTFGCRLGVAGGEPSSSFIRGVDLLCRGAVMPQQSILSSFLSSATSTTAATTANASTTSAVTVGEHVSSLAQAELAAVGKRRTVSLPVSSSSSSTAATAASTTRGVVSSSSSSQQQQHQQFCSESAAASLLWQSPVASWCSIFEAISSAATAAPKVTSPSSSSSSSTTSGTATTGTTTGALLSSAAASPRVPKTVLAPSRAAMLHLAPGGASDRHTARQKLWYENLGAPLNSAVTTSTTTSTSSSSSIMTKLAALGVSADPSTVLAVGSSGPLLFFFAMLEELIAAKKIGGDEVFFGPSSSDNDNCAPPAQTLNSSAVVTSSYVDLLPSLKRQSVLLLAASAMDAALLCLGRYTNVPATILAMFCALEGARELVWGASPSSSRNPNGRSSSSTTFILIQSFFGDLSSFFVTDSDDLNSAAHHLSPTSRPFLAMAVDWAESAIMLRGEMGYLPFFLSPLVALGVAKMTTYGTLTPFVGMGTGTSASSSTSATAAATAAGSSALTSTSSSSGGTKGGISSILPADDVAHWAPILCDLSDVHPALSATLASVFEVASIPYFSRFVSFGAAARMQGSYSITTSFGSQAMVSATSTSPPLGDSTSSVTAAEKESSEPSTPIPPASSSAVLSVVCTQAEDAMLFISSHIESYIRCAAEAAVFYSRAKQRAVALDSTAPSTVDAAAELFFGLLALISAPNVDLSEPEMRCFSSPNAHKLFVLRSLEAAIDAKVKSLPDAKTQSFLFWGHMAACEWRVLSLPTDYSPSTTAGDSGSLPLRRECSVPMPTPLVKRAMEAIPTPFATSPLAFVEIFATRTVDVVPMGEWHRAVSAVNASKGRDAPAAIALSARLTWAAVQKVQETHVSEHLKRLGLSKQQQDILNVHPPHSLTCDPKGADIIADVWRTIKTFYVHRNPLVGISALDNIFKTILLKASLSVHDAIGAAHLLLALVKYPHYAALKTFVEEEAAAEVKAEEEEEAARERARKEEEEEEEVKKEQLVDTVEEKAEQTTTVGEQSTACTLPIGDTTVAVKEEHEAGAEVNGAALVSSNSDDNAAVIDEAKADVKTEAAEEITSTDDNTEDKKNIIVQDDATTSTVEPKTVVSTSNPPSSVSAPPPSPARAALAAATAAVKASASLTPMYVQVNRRMMVSLFLPLMGMLTYATATEAEAIATFTSIVIAKILVPWANQKSPPNPRIPNTSATAGDAAANANPLTLCPADELFPMLPLAGVDTSDESLEKVLRDLTATYEHTLPKALSQGNQHVSSSTAVVAIGGQVSAAASVAPTASGAGASAGGSEGSVSACAAVNALIIKGVCRRVLGLMRLHRKLMILAEDNAIRNAATTTVVPSTTASSSASTSASSTATTTAKTSTVPSSAHSGLIPTITYAQHMAIVAAQCRLIDLPPPEGRSEAFIEIREMIPIGRVVRLRHLVAAAAPNANSSNNTNTANNNTNNNSATGVRSGGLATTSSSTVGGQKAMGGASTAVPTTTGARGVAGSATKTTTVTSSSTNNIRSGANTHQLQQRGNAPSNPAAAAAGASRLGAAAGGNAVHTTSSGGKGTNSSTPIPPTAGGSGGKTAAKTITAGGKRDRSRSRSLPTRSRSRSWSRSSSRGRDRDPRNRRDNTTNNKTTNNAPSRLGGGGGQRFGGNRDNRSRSPPSSFGRDNHGGRGGAPSNNNNNINNSNTNSAHVRGGNASNLPAANNHRDGRDNRDHRDRDTNGRRGGHTDSHSGNDRDRAGGYGRNNTSGTNNSNNNNTNNNGNKRGRSVDSRDRSPEIRGGARRRY